jgi:hypothetical protein
MNSNKLDHHPVDYKLEIEPIVAEITQDYSTQLLIQQELQDIYDALKLINIIYIPQDELEDIENTKNNNINQDEFNYENI